MTREPLARIVGDGIVLREVRGTDSAWLLELRNHPESRRYFGLGAALDAAGHERFLARYLAAGGPDEWYVIERDERPVGTISLYDVDAGEARATWGRFVVAPELRGLGIGRRALLLLLARARRLGLRSVSCEVLEGNERATRLYEKLGFRTVGACVRGDRTLVQMAISLGGTP